MNCTNTSRESLLKQKNMQVVMIAAWVMPKLSCGLVQSKC